MQNETKKQRGRPSKLTDEQKQQILASSLTARELALQYHCSQALIAKLRRDNRKLQPILQSAIPLQQPMLRM